MFIHRLVVGVLFFWGASALENGLARTPPMGWLSWERFRCNTDCVNDPDSCLSENLLKRMAIDLVAEGYADVGYEYVIVDDCWMSRKRADDGSLVADPDRFPSGIKNLTAFIHNLGLKFGIYEDLGTLTCGGYPGSLDYLEIDANTFASWDVDYVKFDGCNSDPANFDEKYPEFGRYLKATGRPIVYSCEWPLYQNAGSESNYTAIAETCNIWRSYWDIEDSYDSMMNILKWHADNQDKLTSVAGPGAWNDPDMLIIGNYALSYEQAKAQMAGWALMPAPLLMSNDLRNTDDKMKSILQNRGVLAVNQDSLGRPGRRISYDDDVQVWVRPVNPIVNGTVSYAVGFISTRVDGTPHRVEFSLETLETDAKRFAVKELFELSEGFFLSTNETLVAVVPPTDAGKTLTIAWVPGHYGIHGNEEVDEIAKQFCDSGKITYCPPPRSDQAATAKAEMSYIEK